MKVVNHRLVYWLGWYLRIRMGWGTGSTPTTVVARRKFTTASSSTMPSLQEQG